MAHTSQSYIWKTLPVDEEGALIESENMEGGREEVQHVASPVRQFGMGTFAAVLMLTGATFAFVTIITNGVSARSSGEDKPRNLEILTAEEAGLALSAATAGKTWPEVESIYSQVESGVATDPALEDIVNYRNANPDTFATAISESRSGAAGASGASSADSSAGGSSSSAAGGASGASAADSSASDSSSSAAGGASGAPAADSSAPAADSSAGDSSSSFTRL